MTGTVAVFRPILVTISIHLRSLTNPKFILCDEFDFLPTGQQEDARHVTERYIGKSDPYIAMISTPNNPGGLFYRIEQEPEDTCFIKE